jgi:hypothetical protein
MELIRKGVSVKGIAENTRLDFESTYSKCYHVHVQDQKAVASKI